MLQQRFSLVGTRKEYSVKYAVFGGSSYSNYFMRLSLPTRAVLTLSKSMFNAGCFSLPYAWKLGGLWVSFILSFIIAGFNWYGNHILVRASQHLAKNSCLIVYLIILFYRSERSALDYGHFAKKVCDYSDIRFLRNNSKAVMYVVNVTILFYQLGMCSVAILFISDNMVSFMYVTAFYLQHNEWRELPGSTNFTSTIMMIGMSMYSFEGQTMILPVENKLEAPEAFLSTFGVLPTTMIICTCFMTALGFYGYTGFGDKIAPTITTNVPKEGFYSTINVFLMLQSLLGHSIAMYVVFDMFFNGFRRKFTSRFPNCPKYFVDKGFRVFWVMVTYLMAVLIPRLEIMIPLVGVTSGTLCALVYPPIFEMITFWTDWKASSFILSVPFIVSYQFYYFLLSQFFLFQSKSTFKVTIACNLRFLESIFSFLSMISGQSAAYGLMILFTSFRLI
uniref:Aa_trans domain-containing protein n=1 Tax=Heterorhabditis bacteriophora TaxID=37862 RepID=A0A1I7WY72_HETBA